MKKNRVRLGVLAVSFMALGLAYFVSPPAAEAQAVFSVKFFGGYNYLMGGDLNNGLKGQLDLMTAFGAAVGYSAQGSYQPVHFALDVGGDVIFKLTPVVSVGAGIGYIETQSSPTQISLNHPVWTAVTLRQDPKVTAIPVRASLFFFIPLGARVNLTIQAGAAYYLAKMHSVYNQAEASDWNQAEIKAEGMGYGFHGGLGLEILLASNLSLVVEGTGKYAQVGNFSGTTTWSSSGGSSHSEQGTLYYFQNTLFPLGTYPLLTMSSAAPSGFGISDVREARIDFSGFTAQAGLLVKF